MIKIFNKTVLIIVIIITTIISSVYCKVSKDRILKITIIIIIQIIQTFNNKMVEVGVKIVKL